MDCFTDRDLLFTKKLSPKDERQSRVRDVKADCLITRNKGDYRVDRIPVMTPEEFLALEA